VRWILVLAVAACVSSQTPVTPDAPVADAPGDAPEEAPLDWRGRSIYFVVTDRFANGDPANDDADGFVTDLANRSAWHGGDFQGLIDRLDYIASMGFTGIWITPVIAQHHAHAYHGYWGYDWSRIDPHLGDAAKLRELVAAARAKNIAVMIDTVANHTGRYNFSTPTFPDPAMYHHNGNITDYNNQAQVENNALSGLDDLAQENPAVRAKLLEHVAWLARESRADGFRVDTVKHVPKPFWTEWRGAAKLFSMAEVLSGGVEQVAPYSHVLDAVLDYPLYYAMRSTFGLGGSARQLGNVLAKDAQYADVQLGGTFLDNHDQPRFLCDTTAPDKVARLRIALAFQFTVRGLPILYYGTEQGFGSCTDNRQDMLEVQDTSAPLYQWIAKLNRIRANTEALRVGVQRERWQDETAYAFEREVGTSAAVVAFNLSNAERTLPLQNLHVPAGSVFTDALGSATFTVGADVKLAVRVPAHGVVILTNTP
jgi:alpha-amylase